MIGDRAPTTVWASPLQYRRIPRRSVGTIAYPDDRHAWENPPGRSGCSGHRLMVDDASGYRARRCTDITYERPGIVAAGRVSDSMTGDELLPGAGPAANRRTTDRWLRVARASRSPRKDRPHARVPPMPVVPPRSSRQRRSAPPRHVSSAVNHLHTGRTAVDPVTSGPEGRRYLMTHSPAGMARVPEVLSRVQPHGQQAV